MGSLEELLSDEKDFGFEEQVLRDPYSLKSWWHYLEYKADAPPNVRFTIYERSVRALPGSYKLWYHYLLERLQHVRGSCLNDPLYEDTNNAFERALVFLHKMPKIWMLYCQFLVDQKKVTFTRHTFDRALKSLPITQHDRIWPIYLKFVRLINVPETAVRVYRRYLKYDPSQAEQFVEYLKSVERLDEAAVQLADLVNNDSFLSIEGKSKHELWADLCQLISKNPDQVHSLNVDAIIRGGIRRYTQEVGRLWCALADYYIRLGHFEKARDVYEEGVTTVNTVRDFTIVFDAYARFEESMLSACMPQDDKELEETNDDEEDEADDVAVDVDLRLARLEHLMNRRPFLVNSVLLRQNPHNTVEWLNRVKLHPAEHVEQIIQTYADAVTTVDPQKATGHPHMLWINFAKFYEQHDDLDNARTIFEKATHANFRQVAQLSQVWCEWAEMELRHQNFDAALGVMRQATVIPKGRVFGGKEDDYNVAVQERLHKSTKLWSFYVDLEESLGTLDSTRAVYDKILDLKIATPQIILNYAHLMEENKFFEESFRVYEKGVALFNYPHALPIWVTYLQKFMERYKGTKIERARELFEQAVENVPGKDAKKLYLMYAKLEEDYGLARRAMLVYDRASRVCPPEDRLELYNLYIRRAAESFGVMRTREIYQKAIENLPDKDLKDICLQFADMEKKLGEVDRARAIFVYGSQFCDPEAAASFWREWDDFELTFGNQDTYQEMLRIKRTVKAQFTQVNFVAGVVAAALPGSKAKTNEEPPLLSNTAPAAAPVSAMAMLEQAQEESSGPVRGLRAAAAAAASAALSNAQKRKSNDISEEEPSQDVNPDEIDIDEGNPDEIEITEQEVPTAVFGDAVLKKARLQPSHE